MTFDEYQKLAIRTVNTKLTFQERLDMLALGLSGESGEASDCVKKGRYHGHPLDETKLTKEVGDVCWYTSGVAETLGFSLSTAVKWTVYGYKERGGDWVHPFDPNDVTAFQKGVEEHQMVPPEERGDRPGQLSEVTHQLCSACNNLAETVCSCAQDLALRRSTTLTEETLWDIQESITRVLTVCAHFAVVLGHPLESILIENVEKLRARYGEAFSAERSLNRPKET